MRDFIILFLASVFFLFGFICIVVFVPLMVLMPHTTETMLCKYFPPSTPPPL